MKNGMLYKVMLVMICGLLFAGCAGGPAKQEAQTSTLKVMFWDESYFFSQYGDMFAMKNPNIEIEVANTQSIYNDEEKDYDKAFAKFVEKEQPDIILLNSNKNYEKFASEGKLMDLDTLIAKDKYDISTIYPALIDLLKEKGGGKLYGLTSSFNVNAIYYNADLFAKYGVEPPHDGMTWQEIIDTARRFPTDGDKDSRIYGYGARYGKAFDELASSIAMTQGLQVLNPDTKKMTINSDSWKKVFQLALDGVKSKAIYDPGDDGFSSGTMEEYYKSQPFIMGRMAMTIDGTNLLQNLKDAKNSVRDYKPFQIGIVAGPVDPALPDSTREVSFNEIFAIRSDSPNADAAWEFLKFINSEEFAKVKSRTLNNGLMSRMGVVKDYEGQSLDAFYKLKPADSSDGYMGISDAPNSFYGQFQQIKDRELDPVQKGSKSLDEALEKIQADGQVALDKAYQEEEAQKKKDGKDDTSS
ncbi:extracellular solute-binding protein [Paenibacillus macerans]|uniref:ABC transporter substrate-binding protein n=1 Tax=Paenibacillus macerans TaxID=44252 RepID=UPI002E1C04CE|nr:extracellular solute-binding protein [Paenibacillus macerans]